MWKQRRGGTWIDPLLADDFGLVGIGGDLKPDRLLDAYRRGIFPWYDEGNPILWWSPNPRAIFELDDFHVSRRLRRTIRSGRFSMAIDQDFGGVMRGCGEGREDGTWIVPEMIEAYGELHRLGHGHSVEAWRDEQLAGGVYGVAIGGFFAGESMFSRERDASKVALACLVEHLRERGFRLFDIQFVTPHTVSLGAVEIPRTEYLGRLQESLRVQCEFL
jgi:leucyl/phenylalanyl-tRNA--protein transferase